ncbi:MAG TPA: helix-turn-helix domain-containing protein, partial [Thermoplasmata archaeon]|nr:helix-turn-helix domain-containing protein [Thermoplasmata archaeon]
MRVAPRVELSPEERESLRRLRQRGGAAGLRAHVVLLAARGIQDLEIGRQVGLHRRTVARWRRRFLRSRVPGIDGRRIAIRPGRIPESTVRSILRSTEQNPGLFRVGPSTRRVASRFGVSHSTVKRVWDSYDVRPAGFTGVPGRVDPKPPLVVSDVVGLFVRPPHAAIAFALRRGASPAGAPGDSRLTPAVDGSSERPYEPPKPGNGQTAPLLGDRSTSSQEELLRFLSELAST